MNARERRVHDRMVRAGRVLLEREGKIGVCVTRLGAWAFGDEHGRGRMLQLAGLKIAEALARRGYATTRYVDADRGLHVRLTPAGRTWLAEQPTAPATGA